MLTEREKAKVELVAWALDQIEWLEKHKGNCFLTDEQADELLEKLKAATDGPEAVTPVAPPTLVNDGPEGMTWRRHLPEGGAQ